MNAPTATTMQDQAPVNTPTTAAANTSEAKNGLAFVAKDFTWLLANRTTAGATPELITEIKRDGWRSWLEKQLNPGRIADRDFEAAVERLKLVPMELWQVSQAANEFQKQTEDKFGSRAHSHCKQEHIARLLYSKRQLHAVMVDFWANHFNVNTKLRTVRMLRLDYQKVLKKNALGKFSTMLREVEQHPAMLVYLNNNLSTAEHPNENLGRELLELHTLGIGNYTETDVLNSARVLTGLGISPEYKRYNVKPWMHWVGPVQVLAWKNENSEPNLTRQTALSMFEYLANHKATARRVCTKLAQHFITETPSPRLVSALAKCYLENDTEIAPVLRMIFHSAEFAQSYGELTRRPMESILASARVLGVKLGPPRSDEYGIEPDPGLGGMNSLIQKAGQEPMCWGPPDGYGQLAEDWASSTAILQRWSANSELVNGKIANLVLPELLQRFHPAALPNTHGKFLDDICLRIFGRVLTDSHRETFFKFFDVQENTKLLSSSPIVSSELRLLITLLLDSPYHMYR